MQMYNVSVRLQPREIWDLSQDWNFRRRLHPRKKKILLQSRFPKSVRILNKQDSDVPDINLTGVKNICDSQTPFYIRALWFLAVTSCFSLTIYQIVDRIKYYYSYPTSTQVQVTQVDIMTLPNITICSGIIPTFFIGKAIAPLSYNLSSFLERLDIKKEEDGNAVDVWNKIRLSENTIVFKTMCDDLNSNELKHWLISHPGMCTVAFEKTEIKTIFGVCYTYSIRSRLLYRGPTTAILIDVVHGHQKRRWPQDRTLLKYEMGFTFYIHSNDIFPDYELYSNGHQIQHNIISGVSLSSKQFKHVDSPLKPCTSAQKFSECINICVDLKLRKDIFSIVNCRIPFTFKTLELPDCNLTETFENMPTIFSAISSVNSKNCSCPRICDSSVYQAPVISRNPGNGLTELCIFFEDNVQELIEESFAYELSFLLSDIGGNLGLFLGCCILSLLELIFALYARVTVFFDKCLRWFRNKYKNNRINDTFNI